MIWTAQEAAKATGGKAQGTWSAGGVSIDSRSVEAGQLFVALKGERVDGHQFVKDALARGAGAAVVSEVPEGVNANAPLLIVKDTFEALQKLGVYNRARSKATFIGVTGSVGKTGTKEALALAFRALGPTYATSGNFNNHLGVPINLASIPPDARFAMIEMGMNHAGEIAGLTKMVKPHIGIITNVEPVHIEFFSGLPAIADAKSEIFIGMKGGIAILNRDNGEFDRMHKAAATQGVKRIITFGRHGDADARLIESKTVEFGTEVVANILGTAMTYRLGTVGAHWAATSLIVLSAVSALGEDLPRAAAALAQFREPEGRGRLHKIPLGTGGYYTLIDDSYNASPPSMKGAFEKLATLHASLGGRGRAIAIVGDMLELGPDAPELHKALAVSLEEQKIGLVFAAGNLMKHLYDALPDSRRGAYAESAATLAPLLKNKIKEGDVVLVKGSHGSKMYTLAEALKKA